MEAPPTFFIPDVLAEEQEAAYADMAAHANCAIPPLAERVYSITFKHDGIEWTATVGRHMRGIKGAMKKVNGTKVWKETPISTSTTIAAIFPGAPFVIFHTGGRSEWANPFYAGDVRVTQRFITGDSQ